MVKRNDTLDTSSGDVRDTERERFEPGCEGTADSAVEMPEAYYRPEMGAVVVTNHPRDDS
jgi:hypothetical protein